MSAEPAGRCPQANRCRSPAYEPRPYRAKQQHRGCTARTSCPPGRARGRELTRRILSDRSVRSGAEPTTSCRRSQIPSSSPSKHRLSGFPLISREYRRHHALAHRERGWQVGHGEIGRSLPMGLPCRAVRIRLPNESSGVTPSTASSLPAWASPVFRTCVSFGMAVDRGPFSCARTRQNGRPNSQPRSHGPPRSRFARRRAKLQALQRPPGVGRGRASGTRCPPNSDFGGHAPLSRSSGSEFAGWPTAHHVRNTPLALACPAGAGWRAVAMLRPVVTRSDRRAEPRLAAERHSHVAYYTASDDVGS